MITAEALSKEIGRPVAIVMMQNGVLYYKRHERALRWLKAYTVRNMR